MVEEYTPCCLEVRVVVVAVFVVLNFVLLLLLLVALGLLRTPKATSGTDPHSERNERSGSGERAPSTDRTDERAPATPRMGGDASAATLRRPATRRQRGGRRSGPAGSKTTPPAELSTLGGDGANNGAAPLNGTATAHGEAAANGVAPSINGLSSPSPDLFLVDRPAELHRPSYIRLIAGLDGDIKARDELLCSVVNQLTPLGFAKSDDTGTHCRLATSDGRTAAITTGRLGTGEDRIELVVDHVLAPDVLSELRRWHRVDLNKSERVQISALIR